MSALPVNREFGVTKDQAAERLATTHYAVDPAIERVVRLIAPSNEPNPAEPIKLLEVNPHTVASGIVPVYFGPHAPSGVPFSSVVIEIHPSEWEHVKSGELKLPHGWVLAPTPYGR